MGLVTYHTGFGGGSVAPYQCAVPAYYTGARFDQTYFPSANNGIPPRETVRMRDLLGGSSRSPRTDSLAVAARKALEYLERSLSLPVAAAGEVVPTVVVEEDLSQAERENTLEMVREQWKCEKRRYDVVQTTSGVEITVHLKRVENGQEVSEEKKYRILNVELPPNFKATVNCGVQEGCQVTDVSGLEKGAKAKERAIELVKAIWLQTSKQIEVTHQTVDATTHRTLDRVNVIYLCRVFPTGCEIIGVERA